MVGGWGEEEENNINKGEKYIDGIKSCFTKKNRIKGCRIREELQSEEWHNLICIIQRLISLLHRECLTKVPKETN